MQKQWRIGNGRVFTFAILLFALFGMVACHESNGTKRIPGTYPPESEIDRKYPPAADSGESIATGDADGTGAAGAGDDAAASTADSGFTGDSGNSPADEDSGTPADAG